MHTVGGVSSDILLQSVHTPNRRCAHGQRGMCLQIDEMYNYTIRLYIYAKLTARESRICARLFFRMKISENSTWVINGWYSVLGWSNLSLGVSLPYPKAEVAKEGCIFDFFTGVNELSLQIIPIPVNCSSSGEVGTESPFSRSLLHWPIQLAAMTNTASSIGHHSQLCEMGQFFVWLPVHPRTRMFWVSASVMRFYMLDCELFVALQMLMLMPSSFKRGRAGNVLSLFPFIYYFKMPSIAMGKPYQ